MAGYTYFDIGTSGKMKGRIYWESRVVSVEANYSSVYARVEVARTDSYGPTTGTFTGDVNINGTAFTFSNHTSVNANWVALKDAIIDVYHNSDGTKQCFVGGTIHGPSGTSMAGQTVSGYQNVWLDTIPRKSDINAFNGNNITGNFNVTYTKKSSGFSQTLRIVANGTTIKTISNYGSGSNFSFTNAELGTLSNIMNNDVNLTAYLDTYSGGTKIGEDSRTNYCIWGRGRIKLGGTWYRAIPYIKINGVWKQAVPYVKVNGSWKKGV